MTYSYPAAPPDSAGQTIQPSPAFRAEVRKVAGALALFGALYLLLLAAGVGLAILLCTVAVFIVTYIHNFWAIVFGLGLAGIGLMVVFFIIKFLFARTKEDNTERVEVHEGDYPELFAFIRAVSEETNTSFPKHIYVASDVNAYVFYDSNFWSMVLPVRKNLVIGLGLVNMLNLSEFKSVIAHEFGHFSQKSMRAGSYVYQVNKVLYNMLYENTGYQAALQRWASVHGIFSLCVSITVKIVQGMQWLLRQAYKLVNRQYMSLSRQMEFHADAIAAKSAGSNNMIHALRRIEFADAAYDAVIRKYNEWLPLQLKGENVFSHQRIIAGFIAADHKLPLSVEGLPVMQEAEAHYRSFERVRIGSQWASHPTRSQREAALHALPLQAEVVDASAWLLFPNAGALQQQFTLQLYRTVQFEQHTVPLDDALFVSKINDERKEYEFPACYDGYYDGRSITPFPLDDRSGSPLIQDLKSFFPSNADTQARIDALRADLQQLEQIMDLQQDIRTFDFDGEQRKRKEACGIRAGLEQELTGLTELQLANDQAVYRYCFEAANRAGIEEGLALQQCYEDYFEFASIIGQVAATCQHIAVRMQAFSGELLLEQARRANDALTAAVPGFILFIDQLRSSISAHACFRQFPLPESFDALNSERWMFLNAQHQIIGERLDKLWDHLQVLSKWSHQTGFKLQKRLLEQQAESIAYNKDTILAH